MPGIDPNVTFNELPPDLEAQLAAINQRKQMAALLGQQAMNPAMPQQTGPVASKMSPLAPFVQALQGYMARKGQEGAATDAANVQQQYQQRVMGERDSLNGMSPQDQIAKLLGSQYAPNRAYATALQGQEKDKQIEKHQTALEEMQRSQLALQTANQQMQDAHFQATLAANADAKKAQIAHWTAEENQAKANGDRETALGFQRLKLQAQQVGLEGARVGLEGQRLGLEGQRIKIAEDAAKAGKVPSGYRTTATGGLEPIPGGPADLKVQGAFNADTNGFQSSMAKLDQMGSAASDLLKHPGLNLGTGPMAVTAKVWGTPGRDFQADLHSLTSQIGFATLNEMRAQSKTGGALGSVSDAEGKKLDAALGALSTDQSPEQMRKNIDKVLTSVASAKERLRAAYNQKYGSGEAPPPLASPAADPNVVDFSKLKPRGGR